MTAPKRHDIAPFVDGGVVWLMGGPLPALPTARLPRPPHALDLVPAQADAIVKHFREAIGTRFPGVYRVYQGNDVPRIVGAEHLFSVADLAQRKIGDPRVTVEPLGRSSSEGWEITVRREDADSD